MCWVPIGGGGSEEYLYGKDNARKEGEVSEPTPFKSVRSIDFVKAGRPGMVKGKVGDKDSPAYFG